jgi:hypothetical protein
MKRSFADYYGSPAELLQDGSSSLSSSKVNHARRHHRPGKSILLPQREANPAKPHVLGPRKFDRVILRVFGTLESVMTRISDSAHYCGASGRSTRHFDIQRLAGEK